MLDDEICRLLDALSLEGEKIGEIIAHFRELLENEHFAFVGDELRDIELRLRGRLQSDIAKSIISRPRC